MSQTLQHQVKPSTDVSLPVQSEPQLQRRAFPHEVESQTDKAIAPPTPISADWQAQQGKIARARFNPGIISLYPANPLKDEKEKPVQRKVDSIVESDETQTKPIQRKVESPPEADEGQAESIQRKTESTAQDELEKDKPSSNKLVQTKLSVGKVGDRYEQEADQVAAKVMTMPDPSRNRIQRQPEQPESEIQPKPLAITPLVQRQASDEEVQTKATQEKQSQPDDTFEARLSGSMAGGSPLPEDVRAFMEPRLGASLKHVRAHTDFNATQMNKELGAQAFTYRNHIFYAAGKAPAKDELTAHELTHVIQQTGAKSLHPSAVGVPTRNTLQAKISRVSNPEEVQPKRAPASAKSDPAFQSVVTNTKAIAVEKKQHPPAQQKVTEVHAAAKPPSNDVESKAQDKQVQAMNQQQPGEFNAKAFQAALKQKIADVAPNTMQETEDFKNQNKVEEVKQDIASQVGNEKQQAAGPIEQKTQEAPNPKGITPKSVTPLPRKKLGKAGRVAAKGAAPKRKDESEVSLEAGSQQLDQQMSSAKVTEEQLKKSNEPKFQDAANAKKTAQTDAAKAPDQYRQREQGVVAGAEMQAQMTTSKDLDAMHTTQDRHVTQVLGKQGDAKGKDEQKRSHVSDHIQGIYNRTKQKVETILNQLDQDANHTFDQGATRAQNEFNDYVDRQMRMYKIRRYLSHPGGAFLWAKDKLLGLPDEVNVFYEQGRTRYLTSMDRAIAQVSNLVANRLKAAKAEITGGKKEIQTYVAGLEPSLRQVGQEAAKNIQSQFDDLEQSVNDKQNQLIESLAQKYNDNLKTLDDRINQMKDANKGLVQKAMDKVRDTINTIRDLTNMMMGVLRRAAGVIQLIIKDPIAFLTNLISGLKQGFLNFKANIGKHLQQGLMGFLTGTMGGTITMPSSFDPKGIFSLVTQVLGVTYASIRSKATGKWGEKKVGHLETSFDVFKTLKREGVGGLWNQIKGQIGDLKSLVLDGIRNFLIEKVVVAGVLWIISLFNPATAFIRACKAIVDIIRFFIERGSQIMELMNAVMDAIVAIAQGSLGAAAKLVESAMAKALPVVLGFIASLLGIGGLTKKVQDIIQKVRKPIDKGIDQVFGKADKFIKTLGGKAKDSKLGQKAVSARDTAKRKKEEAQKWAEEKKEAGRRAIEQQKDKLKQKIAAGKNKFANSKVGQKLAAVDQWARQKIDGLKNKWDKAKKLPGKVLTVLKSKGKNLWDKANNKFKQSKLGQWWESTKNRFGKGKNKGDNKNSASPDERKQAAKRKFVSLMEARKSMSRDEMSNVFIDLKDEFRLSKIKLEGGRSNPKIGFYASPPTFLPIAAIPIDGQRTESNRATTSAVTQGDYIKATHYDGPHKTPRKEVIEQFTDKFERKQTGLPGEDSIVKAMPHNESSLMTLVNAEFLRAGTVEAQSSVTRGKGRSNRSGRDTRIGHLGVDEEIIKTGASNTKYNGGHLVGDFVMDSHNTFDLFEEWNLAPQHRDLNDPLYKLLSEKPIVTAINQGATIRYTSTVQYPDDTYTVKSSDLITRLFPESNKYRKQVEGAMNQNPALKKLDFVFKRRTPGFWQVAAEVLGGGQTLQASLPPSSVKNSSVLDNNPANVHASVPYQPQNPEQVRYSLEIDQGQGAGFQPIGLTPGQLVGYTKGSAARLTARQQTF